MSFVSCFEPLQQHPAFKPAVLCCTWVTLSFFIGASVFKVHRVDAWRRKALQPKSQFFFLPSVTLKEHPPQSWLATKSADASMTSPEMSSGTMNSWIPSLCICHPSFHVPFQAAIHGILKSHRPMLVVDPCGRQLNARHRHFRRRPGLRFQRNRCRQCPRWRRCHSPQ